MRRCAVVATVVSSVAVGKMAQIEGFEFHQTATGFKNIGSKGLQLKQQARCLAAVNDVHSDNIFTALKLATRRSQAALHAIPHAKPASFFD